MVIIMFNIHNRLILGTLVSVFLILVISVPNSYSAKNVYRDARCDCVNDRKGGCRAIIGLKKIDNQSQGSSLNYYSIRIQVPQTRSCAKVNYYVGSDPYNRIVTESIYTENFNLTQDISQTDVRVDSCVVCGDLYRDTPSEKSEEEKKYIDKSLESLEKSSREDNEYFENLNTSEKSAKDDELALLEQEVENEIQLEKQQDELGLLEQEVENEIQQEMIRQQELLRQNELQRQIAEEEGDDDGGFFDFLGDVLLGVAVGSAFIADIEGGTSHNSEYMAGVIQSIQNKTAPPPYPTIGQNSLNSGSGNCAYEKQKLPELQRLMNQANNSKSQGVCAMSRATAKLMQLTFEINKRCNRPQAQIQSSLDTLNGAKESARASCEAGRPY